jgi:hypothetical protein
MTKFFQNQEDFETLQLFGFPGLLLELILKNVQDELSR